MLWPFSLIICLALTETAVRLGDLDVLAMRPLLYYQRADLASFQPSKDGELLYELKPNSKAAYSPREADRAMHAARSRRTVTINSLGFRDRERSAVKPKGVFRIICIGGANTYGADVNDDETYPAVLERELNAALPGKYEVWNAGVNAYVLHQETALAERIVAQYDPDLIILQQHNNTGRRAFLYGQPFLRYFEDDPRLYQEELDFIPFGSSSFAVMLLEHWRFYRAVIFALNYGRLVPGETEFERHSQHPLSPAEEEELNIRPFESFYARFQAKLPIILLTNVENHKTKIAHFEGTAIRKIDLEDSLPPSAPPEFRLIHPPAHVYRWYAAVIMKSLQDLGFLPKSHRASTDKLSF